ncbi:ABC transporter transmembrane domain-containing protein [Sporolactobacillus terrae]|uniref:Multidrug ABC transporter permease/ATP-binding protein n=1 Tax=Sporolactobacillus terrae TaxID=269673 RepID=A0ABX5Q7U2_9BACL|nr:ABC transporter transmembrane domain-containing protein [Sporolactobacillus terrae]QAA22692.1 multidrug ABC transporter permease/ATP-binding protein [Sporolactobacillus terrae]QAA25665.1 multidrug ABC transporter permease/ATP-binding protein [Sporolactobacillus terrae]UAK17476.1 ATP-binding cassette domain-containing protein [Sporolactobacillus terrae]
MHIFFDLWWFFKQERMKYGFGIIFLMLSSFLSMIPPYVVGVLVDDIRTRSLTPTTLISWILFLIIIGIIYYACGYIWRQWIFGSSIILANQLRNSLYKHFTKLSPNFFQKRRIGDLMAHATNDINAVQNAAGEGILTLIDSITMGGMVIVTMSVLINWKLTLITLLPMPIMVILTMHYGNLLHQRFGKAQAAFSDLNDKVQENVSGVRVIKAFGEEEAQIQLFRKASRDVVDKNIAVAKVDSLFDPTITFIVAFCYFLALIFGSVFVMQGSMTLGSLTSFTLYLGQLVWPMLAFGFLFNIVERGSASYDRIHKLLAIKPEITDQKGASEDVPSGAIAYAIKEYSYPGNQAKVLSDIHITVEQGQTLGIVGKTGAGKTTMLRLLLREFDVIDGQISIGAMPIRSVKLDALRSAIGYVPQDHILFSATIAENIAFAKPDASREAIERVAKLASIHEDILHFKEGYETIVGERGVTLSGGQKQRISIARALLADPEILIFDDSLSAVDARTEVSILHALKHERINKTTLISAHRLSAVEHADQIVVLDEGKIIEHGTHEALIKKNGWYAEMYAHQQLESLVSKGGEKG